MIDAGSTPYARLGHRHAEHAAEWPGSAAAYGFVVAARHGRTLSERGRYVEYLFAFGHGSRFRTTTAAADLVGLLFDLPDHWLRAPAAVPPHARRGHGPHLDTVSK